MDGDAAQECLASPLVRLLNREIEDLDRTVDEGLEHLDSAIIQMPRYLEEHQDDIDKVLSRMLVGLVREVDVREIVLEQLSTVTTQQLEDGFKQFSDDKLSFITLLGGILGVIGGSVIVWPIPSLAALAALGLGLWVLDLIAKPLMESSMWPRRRRRPPQQLETELRPPPSPPEEAIEE